MITTFFTNLLSPPNLYYNSHYEKFANGTVKCIDEDIPFDIPESWCWCRLGDIFQHNTGKALNSANKVGTLKKYLTTSNVYWNRFDFSTVKEMYFKDDEIEKCSIKKGDLLVCEGGDIGRAAIWDKDDEMCIQNHIHRLRAYIEISTKYIYYIFWLFKRNGVIGGKGIGIQGLSANALHNILIPFPPFNEQFKIVLKLEAILAVSDKYEEKQNKLDKLESELQPQLKKSILQYAIQGKLVAQNPTDEPASELLKRINEEKEQLIKAGKIKRDKNTSIIFKGDDNKYYEKLDSKTTEITEEIPYELPNNWSFVRLSNLCWLDDGIKASGEKLPYLDAKYHRGKSEITYLTQGKVVEPPCKAILVDGENSGEIFNITEKGYLGSTFKVLQISKCISEEWLHFLLDTYRDLFKNSKVGAAIPHLNKNLFRNLIVSLPPIEEQQRITNKIEKLIKGIEGI